LLRFQRERRVGTISLKETYQFAGRPITRDKTDGIGYTTEEPTEVYSVSPVGNSNLLPRKKGKGCPSADNDGVVIKIVSQIVSKAFLHPTS
tara:strand:+ start:157 stop:429 length:273 start_codon:yes stop_codon:yes gene_type:complete